MATTSYQEDKSTFFKWFMGISSTVIMCLMGALIENQMEMQKNITTLVAAQPFVLSNIDDTNKRLDFTIETQSKTDSRQDNDIAELRKMLAILPDKFKIK